ncbi:MAG: universal stress protein, partial [Actinobacteria bacterium]|nr:universal stress protein [Actinomycetota bacterium]
RLVVGVDLSPGCLAAVDWSVREARRRDASVILVHSLEPDRDRETPTDVAGALLETFRDRVRDLAPHVDLRLVITHNEPVAALVDASAHAGLVVLGSRGRAGFTDSALGSVAQQVIVRAACPVVVVPPDGPRTRLHPRPERIVAGLPADVGVELLDCAAELAWSRSAILHLVPLPDDESAPRTMTRATTYIGHRYPGVRLDVAPVTGDDPLATASRDADLLVVGCHHSDEAFGCRTGDIAAQALLEATGPVVLVGAG